MSKFFSTSLTPEPIFLGKTSQIETIRFSTRVHQPMLEKQIIKNLGTNKQVVENKELKCFVKQELVTL